MFNIEKITINYGLKENIFLLHSVIRRSLSNMRAGLAKIKLRSDVAYTKKKQGRQKQQSRARRSNKSSPIFRGGGSVNQVKTSFTKKINRKELRQALKLAIQEKNCYSINDIPNKTKDCSKQLSSLEGKKILYICEKEANSLKNIPFVRQIRFENINPLKIFKNDSLLIEKSLVDNVKAL